jgi:hypothetical protein
MVSVVRLIVCVELLSVAQAVTPVHKDRVNREVKPGLMSPHAGSMHEKDVSN